MTINQKLESIKKTFQEYNLDLKRINEVIKDVVKLEQSNKDLLNTIIEAQKVIKNVWRVENEKVHSDNKKNRR